MKGKALPLILQGIGIVGVLKSLALTPPISYGALVVGIGLIVIGFVMEKRK